MTGSTSAISSAGSNCGARAIDRAGVVDDDRAAVEDELVLAADEAAERDRREVVARALLDHLLAPDALARDVRRGRQVDDHARAGERLVRQRRAGLPDVLTDRQPDGDAVDLDRRAALAGLEVAQLVEDAVVGQVQLAVARLELAVGEDRGGVVDVLGALGIAHDGDDPGRVGGDPLQGGACVGEEVLLEQQILRRVAGQCELGEDDELGAGVVGEGDAGGDLALVAGDVAHDGVHLDEGDAQRPGHSHSHYGSRPSQYSMNRSSAGSRGPDASSIRVAVTAVTGTLRFGRCCSMTA